MNEMKQADFLAIGQRWGVHSRTVRKWLEVGAEVGEDPGLTGEDAVFFLEWYRKHIGREPAGKLVKKAAELNREAGVGVLVDDAAVDLGPVEMIGRALERLGLSLSFARVIEEEERAHESYQEARREGMNTDAARRRWRDAQEMKRALQKTEDVVRVAEELMREWVRKEFEPVQREVRESFRTLEEEEVLGLLNAGSGDEVREIWGEAVDRRLRGEVGGGDGLTQGSRAAGLG